MTATERFVVVLASLNGGALLGMFAQGGGWVGGLIGAAIGGLAGWMVAR